MGPLAFSAGSHRYNLGRELEISDDSEKRISKELLEKKLPIDETPFDLGEVSYHYGWTFHRAGANKSTEPRRVMTVIYIDDEIRVAPPRNKHQEADWKRWMPNTQLGGPVDSPINPVIYRAE
jgi:ectoine hydroxylase-related dioxygenase (phytanoyl-CoA dioxygenase family)